MGKIKVGIVGYGTIGKRVADAIRLQQDMELVGITANSYNYRIMVANQNKIPIFVNGSDEEYKKNHITPAGTYEDLFEKVDVVVDCTPKFGKANKEKYYVPLGVKAIFQGGEKEGIAQVSFVASVNYSEAVGKQFVRVVSCNTTGLCRTLSPLDKKFGIERVTANLIRRGGDPHESDVGPMNAIVPSLDIPSHHGPDVKTVMKGLDIFTTAIVVPTTIMHMHVVNVSFKNSITKEEILSIWKKTRRVRLVRGADKIDSTAAIMELARDLGHKRGDMMEICIWEEALGLRNDHEISYMQAVHQESDVVPENIDAIRAIMGYADAEKSIDMTNKSLGL